MFYFRDVLFQCRAQCLVLGVALWLSLFFNLPNTLKCQVRVLLQRCFVSMSCSMSCIGCRIVVIIVLTCQTLLNVKCVFYFRDVLFQCRAQCLVLGVALWLSLFFLTCQTLLNVKCVFYFRDVLFQCRAQCLVLGVALWLSLFFNLPNTLKCQVRVLLQRCFVSMSCSMSCIGCRIVVIIVFNLPNTLKCQVRVLVQGCFVSMSCLMSCIGCRIVVIIVF